MNTERLSFGHGFIPRIGSHNYKALDRALAQPDLFDGQPADLSWVIIDGTWARPEMPVLAALRSHHVRLLVDTQAWRYGDERTWDVAKYVKLGHRPAAPLSMADPDAIATFVKADVAWQRAVGADALLLPGLMPSRDDDSGFRSLDLAVEVALSLPSTVGIPVVGFLGVHSRSLASALSSTYDSLIQLLSSVYVQISPVNPMVDSVSKLVEVAQTMLEIENAGRPVVAGHLGAFGGVLRSLGVSAADAGLGMGETFDAMRILGSARRRAESGSPGGPTGARRYVSQVLRSVSRRQWESLMSVDSVRALLDCRLACCRFRTPDDRTEWAREHSLRSRVRETTDLAELAPSMRTSRQLDVIRTARTSLVTVNSALTAAGHPPLLTEHVENQLAALQRLVRARQAA